MNDDVAAEPLSRWHKTVDKIEQRLFEPFEIDGQENVLEANACALHGDYVGNQHNCVACNLAGQTNELLHICKTYCTAVDPSEEGKMQALLYFANPIVDSCSLIFDVVGFKSEGFEEIFPNFITVKRWTNFFKHPGGFAFTHHAEFQYVQCHDLEKTVVNTGFIKEHYSSNTKKQKAAREKLSNNDSVVVILPEPSVLIEGFADDFDKFVTLIKNDIIKERLSSCSVIDNYFDAVDDE